MKLKTTLVFNLVILAICLINSCYSVDLDPYGPPIDNDLHCHACTSGNVIPQGSTITYFGEVYTEMYVSSNGIISLGCDAEDELSFQKSPMIAPYLSDIDTRLINNAVVDGSVFYRTEVGDDVEFDTWVLDHFGIPFLTSYEVIATWDHVKELDQSTSARNTFQVIVYSSAYGDTAVCFNYPSNGLNWPDASNPPHSIYPIAGFYSGSDLNIAYYLPGSGTPSVSDLDDLEGNFGEIGQFCYIVSALEVISDCTYDFLTCRPPSFFPINTPLTYADVLSQYAHCNDQDLTIDTTSFNCNQLGDLVPVTAQIGSLSCISYFIPVVYNKLAYINCPSNIHLYSNEPTTVNWQAPTITGDCQLQGHEYVNYQPNYSLFPIGTTTVTYHTYDVNYNHVYCNFDVTIESYVTIIYHVIDILNRPINAAAIGGNPDCQYTDVYGICQVTSNNLLVGDFIPAGYFYVNFNGNIYSIPHGDIYINCLNVDITLIISPPGFYRSSSGDILPCAPGTYSTIYEASSCYPCEKGTYNNDYFQTSCEYCPTGYYSSTGATECFSCYAGYYLDQYSGSCELCPAGTYSCDRSIQCEPCPYGSYSSPGSSECSYCSSGYYLDQYSNLCTICPANTYSSDRATICTPCSTGYYSPPGSSYCSSCNAGYYLDLASYQCLACPSGFYSCDRAISCDACPTGGYSTPGSSSCTFCTAGYYRDLDDTCDSPPCGCSPCPAGSYSCDRADVCEVCPPGSWSMPGSATCFSCSAGYYLDTQTGSCIACEANTYSLDRALYCSDCPDGSYSAGGSSECTFCIGGYYYNNYTGSCETCPAGTYSHSRATSCTPCPIGGYSFDGSTECSYCTSGYYLNQYTMNCQACESGTYSCDRSIECTKCPEGSFSTIGSSNCSYCIAGYYYDQYSDSCLPCAPGTFSSDRASSCMNCPLGYYSQAGSSSCYSCTAGYYLDLSTGQCTACPIGFTSYDRAIACYLIPVTPPVNEVITCSIGYYIELATNSCIPCPPNTFSTTDRSTECIPCPYGSYSNMASSTCTFCNAGYYFDVSSSTCYPCPANYFSPDRATQCFPCPFNSYSSIASSYCTACPNGTYLDQSGSCRLCDTHSFYYNGVCIPCDLSFSSDYCPFCPPGYESDVVCNECCEGFYSPDGNTCLPCPDGAYSGPGYSQCVYCPEGYMWDDDRHNCYPCDT